VDFISLQEQGVRLEGLGGGLFLQSTQRSGEYVNPKRKKVIADRPWGTRATCTQSPQEQGQVIILPRSPQTSSQNSGDKKLRERGKGVSFSLCRAATRNLMKKKGNPGGRGRRGGPPRTYFTKGKTSHIKSIPQTLIQKTSMLERKKESAIGKDGWRSREKNP